MWRSTSSPRRNKEAMSSMGETMGRGESNARAMRQRGRGGNVGSLSMRVHT